MFIAAVIRRTSPGPVFYTQERMGLDGHAFQVYKFRSMAEGAEDETGPVWARGMIRDAPSIGRWLRGSIIDELPQLWNVLRGDMSIVGPRPERPYFVDQFKHRIPQYMLRHKVKAGITGWAQVNGWRGNTSLEKRISTISLHRELVGWAGTEDDVAHGGEGPAISRRTSSKSGVERCSAEVGSGRSEWKSGSR